MRVLFSLLTVFALSAIAWIRTENFSPNAIAGPLEGFSSETELAFSEVYHYLASGRQAYVFVSEDGRAVLKFFKKSYYSTPWYGSFLPSPWKEREGAKRKKRQEFYSKSYKIAAEQFKEETGLLFVHFGKSQQKLPPIRVIDKAHRLHEIDLNAVPFVLQKRAEPLYSVLLEKRETAERVIDLFISQIAKRIAFGIADGDQDVGNNFGLLDGNLLHLDPGRLFYDETLQEPARRQHEWWRGTHRFRKWLTRQMPEAVAVFDEKLQEEI